jgi:tetratricopeptide (TPR) repeat protein
VRIPVEALLMEGARRIDEWSRIENRIPHVGVVPSLAPPPDGGGGELDLLPPEWEVLALIDGERSVRGLATELGRSDFDVAKTLFGLESAGVIVLVDPGSAKRGRPSATSDLAELVAKAERALQAKDLDAARAAAEQAGSMQPHDATSHLLLGRIHLAQGHASAAAEELRRALRLDPMLAAAHRQLGFALVAMGRFGEAVASWDQWEPLAGRSPDEDAQRAEVLRARDAARVFSHG